MLHLNITIYGQVQGVTFRYSAKEQADSLNIKGFVKNQSDGSVFIEAEGEKENLNQFATWCRSGPTFAKVEKIAVEEGQFKHYQNFAVY